MSYSISFNNFKKVAAVATFLATAACLVPDSAQALLYRINRNPNDFGVGFELDTAIKDTDGDSTNMSGKFPKAIRNFSVFNENLKNDRNFNDDPTLIGTERNYLFLKVEPFQQSQTIFESSDIMDYFPEVGGSIYRYYFKVVPAISNTLDQREQDCVDIDLDNPPSFCEFQGIDSLSWLVPSKFTYALGDKTFDIDLGDGSSLLANSLNGLEEIVKKAAANGIEEIVFPGIIPTTNNLIKFKTQVSDQTKVPEPGASTGVLAFGFLGVIALIKRKIQ